MSAHASERARAEFGQFIREEHPAVGQVDLAKSRSVTTTNQPSIADGAWDARKGPFAFDHFRNCACQFQNAEEDAGTHLELLHCGASPIHHTQSRVSRTALYNRRSPVIRGSTLILASAK